MKPPVRVLAAAALTLAAAGPAGAREELNVLAWCDHSDAALFAPFEAANDVKVNVKVYELTGAALSILEQSRPGDWDLIVVDTADVVRMAKAGWFEELNPADFPYADFFEGATAPHLHEVDGKLHGVPEKFGFNTLSYDKAALNFDRIEGFLANSYAYGAADEELDRAMVEAWTEFLAH